MSRTALTKRTARKKGLYTLAAGAGTTLAFIYAGTFLGLVGIGLTGYLGYQWLRYRGQWGMRF